MTRKTFTQTVKSKLTKRNIAIGGGIITALGMARAFTKPRKNKKQR